MFNNCKNIKTLAKKYLTIKLEIFEFDTYISIHGVFFELQNLLKRLKELNYKCVFTYNSRHLPTIQIDKG